MPPKLATNPQVRTLARDLGLRPADDALRSIVEFARRTMRSYIREIPCATLSQLLSVAAGKVDTLFVDIHSDEELIRVKERYLREGEVAFADLERQLGPDVFAITFKRLARRPADRQFISVIDCRGEKGPRSYFSKWHEIAHLLTLTSQQRLKFCRSHLPAELRDPEEAVMDVIAGNLGFFDEIVRQHMRSALSFDAIANLRERLCPEASMQATFIGFVHAWPQPCLLIEADLALKKRDAAMERLGSLGFDGAAVPELRAVVVISNDAARKTGLFVPRNMRIPEESVIARVVDSDLSSLEAREDLSWWIARDGSSLAEQPVFVRAKRAGRGAHALIVPAE